MLVMLWSQIKLTLYDFSDLHITGEFDNGPFRNCQPLSFITVNGQF